MDLDSLFTKYGSDKGLTCEYGKIYEEKLAYLKDQEFTLLEIGVCNPGRPEGRGIPSLLAWREWFPKAKIIGADIRDFTEFIIDRIDIVRMDQGDPHSLLNFAEDKGPFDVVIDDGSHKSSDILVSFDCLLPYTSKFYFIEDLHMVRHASIIKNLVMGQAQFLACKHPKRYIACVEV
jgi:hypothetical protein